MSLNWKRDSLHRTSEHLQELHYHNYHPHESPPPPHNIWVRDRISDQPYQTSYVHEEYPNQIKRNKNSILPPPRHGQMNQIKPTEQTTVVKSVGLLTLFIIAMPRLPIQMAWAAQWQALNPYLERLDLITPQSLEYAKFIGPITGLIVGPTVGVLTDRCTHPWGRRRPFLLFSAIATVICWFAMAYTTKISGALASILASSAGHDEKKTWTAVIFLITNLWMDVTVNILQIPTYLLVADAAGERQMIGACMGQFWSNLAPVLLDIFARKMGNPSSDEYFPWFLGYLSVVMLIIVIIACAVADETPLDPNAWRNSSTVSNSPDLPNVHIPEKTNESQSVYEQLKSAVHAVVDGMVTLRRQLSVYAILMFCVQYGIQAFTAYKVDFFGTILYHGDKELADGCGPPSNLYPCSISQEAYLKGKSIVSGTSVETLTLIVGIIYLICLPFLVRKFGVKWIMVIATLPQALLIIVPLNWDELLNRIIATSIVFTGTSLFLLIVPVIYHVLGRDAHIGMYVGAMNSANCFAIILNFSIGQAMIDTELSYALPIFVSGVFGLVALLVSLVLFHVKCYSW